MKLLFVLRNLSSAEVGRQAMRNTPGLVDSLMYYIQKQVANNNPDDKVKLIGSYATGHYCISVIFANSLTFYITFLVSGELCLYSAQSLVPSGFWGTQ